MTSQDLSYTTNNSLLTATYVMEILFYNMVKIASLYPNIYKLYYTNIFIMFLHCIAINVKFSSQTGVGSCWVTSLSWKFERKLKFWCFMSQSEQANWRCSLYLFYLTQNFPQSSSWFPSKILFRLWCLYPSLLPSYSRAISIFTSSFSFLRDFPTLMFPFCVSFRIKNFLHYNYTF